MSYFGVSLRNGIGLGLGTVPSLSSTPLAYRLAPTLTLSFAGATALDPRITFTRASSATFTNSAGLVASAATNVARLDYDPVTLQPKGLLIEEARTNLLTYSEQFDNAAWTKNLASVTSDVTVSPSGIVDADKIIEAVGVSDHSVYRNPTLLVNTAYTFSIFAKANTRTKIGIALGFTAYGGISVRAHFNLITGTFITSANSPEAYSIVDVGNNWYKISITKTTSVAGNGSVAVYTLDESGAFTYNGDGTSGLYIWGAQLEAGAFATSYIPTVAAQTTRAAENAVMTGTNFSSWYNQTEGTLYSSGAALSVTSPTNRHISAFELDNANYITLTVNTVGQLLSNGQASGVSQWAIVNSTVITANQNFKVSVAFKINDIALVYNALTPVTDTNAVIPVPTQLGIGKLPFAGQYFNGTIASITYWPRRLSNAELQAVTS